MRETTVEKHLRKRVIAAGGLIRKMIWPGHRGAPDRLVVWPGFRVDLPEGFDPTPGAVNYVSAVSKMVRSEMPGSAVIHLVELKRPGGRLDDHQVREHQKLRDMGCAVYTLDSIEAVDAYIAERTS